MNADLQNPVDPAVEDMLAKLRDIHGAADPGWWPPAPGWWLVAALVLAALLLVLRWAFRKWSERRRRHRYLAALERIEQTLDPAARPHEFLAELNRLFRAVALRAFPRARVARLQGRAWTEFLRAELPDSAPAGIDALAAGPWQPAPDFDADALRAAARAWVRRHG